MVQLKNFELRKSEICINQSDTYLALIPEKKTSIGGKEGMIGKKGGGFELVILFRS